MSTMENLGAANFHFPIKSLKIYTQLLRIVMKVYGPNHLLCAKFWSRMGRIHLQNGNYPRVLECIMHVTECYRKNCIDDAKYISEYDRLVKEELVIKKQLEKTPLHSKVSSSLMATI